MKLVEQSIALKEDWWNLWTKAQLLHARGRRPKAIELLDKVDEGSGEKADCCFAADDVKKARTDWKK